MPPDPPSTDLSVPLVERRRGWPGGPGGPDLADAVLKAPLSLKAIGGALGIFGLVWAGATQVTSLQVDIRQLRSDIEQSRQANDKQQEQLDRLRTESASTGAVLAELRATMGSLRSSMERIETRLFDMRPGATSAPGGAR